jgi:hypothetical protein
MTAEVISSYSRTGSGGISTPFLGSGLRLSASKFQRRPAGLPPSIRMPVRRRCHR